MHANFSLKVVSAAALLLSPVFVFASSDGTFDRTLNVSGHITLSVNTGSGYIHVSPGSDNQIHIIGHVRAGHGGWFDSGSGSADEQVKHIVANPPIEQNGSDIRVGKTHSEWFHNVSIDYDVTAPKGTDLDANSGSGDLRLNGLGGPLRANTGSGNIEASAINGRVDLNTGSGDIRAAIQATSDVRAQTGSGSIRLDNVQGTLRAQTGSGSMEIQGQPTDIWKLGTGSGDVTLRTGSSHFTLDASTGSGSVHSDPPLTTHGNLERHHIVGDINGGGPTVRVETGSGDIHIL